VNQKAVAETKREKGEEEGTSMFIFISTPLDSRPLLWLR
jgi:hypothetical protein